MTRQNNTRHKSRTQREKKRRFYVWLSVLSHRFSKHRFSTTSLLYNCFCSCHTINVLILFSFSFSLLYLFFLLCLCNHPFSLSSTSRVHCSCWFIHLISSFLYSFFSFLESFLHYCSITKFLFSHYPWISKFFCNLCHFGIYLIPMFSE